MRIELKAIHKRFGAVHANNGIDLTVAPRAIHGLLGENGAGKSTLMKILSGFIRRDSGEILLDGKRGDFKSPAEAIRAGIGMLHQDPLDFPALPVIDNFLIGHEGGIMQDRARALADLNRYASHLGFDIHPDALVGSLTFSRRQQLEIMRLLSFGAGILILDEPTTGISPPQKAKLFETLNLLVGEGLTVLFVTHKLEEARQLCDRVTVLRMGRVAGELIRPFTTDQMVKLMFGQSPAGSVRETPVLGEPVLELRNACVADGRLRVQSINLQVRAGEIIGLAGIGGSGQHLVLRACAGLDRLATGEIRIAGTQMNRQAYGSFLDRGVAYLPAGRLEEGLVPGLSLMEHFILTDRTGGSFVNWGQARSHAQEMIKEYDIRGTPDAAIESLSGGNRQRALFALLHPDLKVLLLDHPTRGLDVESMKWVWNRLLERSSHGTAIVFASSDLDEIFEYSDRVLVFSGGRIIGTLSTRETSLSQLGELIGGNGL
jgi:simple sugar transport system ATP-binding protein